MIYFHVHQLLLHYHILRQSGSLILLFQETSNDLKYERVLNLFQTNTSTGNKANDYKLALKQIAALSADEEDAIAILANASALLNQLLDDIYWVGFYIWRVTELVHGPFQRLLPCIRH